MKKPQAGADAEAADAEKKHLLERANADLVSGEKDIQIQNQRNQELESQNEMT